jgi:deoxyribodipyrimidine photolyase
MNFSGRWDRPTRVPWKPRIGLKSLTPSPELVKSLPIDRSVERAERFVGGTTEALASLKRFAGEGPRDYADRRKTP